MSEDAMTEELKPLPCPFEEWWATKFPEISKFNDHTLEVAFKTLACAAWSAALARSPAWRDDMSEAPRNKDLYLWSRKHGLVVGYFAPGMDHYRKPTAIYKGAHIEFQPTYWQLPLPPEEKA